MKSLRKKYQLSKLYEIQNNENDPFRDCSRCNGYRQTIIMPSKWVQFFCWCNIDRYVKIYNCTHCYGTGKIKK